MSEQTKAPGRIFVGQFDGLNGWTVCDPRYARAVAYIRADLTASDTLTDEQAQAIAAVFLDRFFLGLWEHEDGIQHTDAGEAMKLAWAARHNPPDPEPQKPPAPGRGRKPREIVGLKLLTAASAGKLDHGLETFVALAEELLQALPDVVYPDGAEHAAAREELRRRLLR